MTVRFIVNPQSGGGRGAREWRRIQPLLSRRTDWDVRFTAAPGHATELAQQAVTEGIPRVIAVGGDGTVHETANGLLGTQAALGVVPAGTGNDFRRTVHVPADPARALQIAFGGAVWSMDVGQMLGGPCFINVAGFGFDAEVAVAARRYPRLFGSGTIPYLMGVLSTLRHYRPVPMQIYIDGKLLRAPILLMAMAIGEYFAGGMRIAPGARADDGLFEICIAGDLSRVETLLTLPLIYSGNHVKNRKVTMTTGRRVTVDAVRSVAIQADGEVIGRLPAEFELRPAALHVIRGSATNGP